jgi:hypothetical protein
MNPQLYIYFPVSASPSHIFFRTATENIEQATVLASDSPLIARCAPPTTQTFYLPLSIGVRLKLLSRLSDAIALPHTDSSAGHHVGV